MAPPPLHCSTQVYDPVVLEAYYKKRPQLMVQRMLQLGGAFGGFVTALVIDNVRGTLKENEVCISCIQLYRSIAVVSLCDM
jgi:hypothetical protein